VAKNPIDKLLQQAQEKRIAILEERLAKTTNLKEIDNIMKMLQKLNKNENEEDNEPVLNTKPGISSLIIGGQKNEKSTDRY